MYRMGNPRDSTELNDDVKAIELWPCGCKARATVIARAADSIGRPITQYELCAPHAKQIAERERGKGRGIIRR